jgi:hypothetical protein
MPELETSDVIKNLLTTLINISGRKTNKGHAITTMDTLIKQLETRYAFLKNVEIKDTRYIEDGDPVSVMSDINAVMPSEMGKAVHEIITTMNRSLGKSAGIFFIKELQSNLNEDHEESIRNMGVDLRLMQLEREIEEWEKLTTKKE